MVVAFAVFCGALSYDDDLLQAVMVGDGSAAIAPTRVNRNGPLRWGKRHDNVEDDVGLDEQELPEEYEELMRLVRSPTPLRWGKRSTSSYPEAVKRAPLRWGKRAHAARGYLYSGIKRAPLRWGKRAASGWYWDDLANKRAPLRWGKRAAVALSR